MNLLLKLLPKGMRLQGRAMDCREQHRPILIALKGTLSIKVLSKMTVMEMKMNMVKMKITTMRKKRRRMEEIIKIELVARGKLPL